jgi:hypothetical protein
MKWDDRTIALFGDLASAGSFILAAISLFLKVWRSPMSEQDSKNSETSSNNGDLAIALFAILGMLIVAAAIVYFVTILISTSSHGTLTQLVTRAATWATFLGLGVGIFIGQWLPKRLSRLIRDRRGGS